MKCARPIGLLLTTLCLVYSMPTETTTTTRSTPSIGNATKNTTNQLGENNSAQDVVYDSRTPPKVKQQVQNKMKIKNEIENSHAGVAIPVDEDLLEMEETTKKLNFYKIERPTTNSGLSTWILLSGQASTTSTTKAPIIKPITEAILQPNLTMVVNDKPIRTVKPIFKQRPSTTSKPVTTTTTPRTVTNTTKLTKIKASLLSNSTTKKSNMTVETTTKRSSPLSRTTTRKPVSSTTVIVQNNTITNYTLDSSTLPLESKNDEIELPTADNNKKKNPSKRKKNKTRRRKPSDKDSNSTIISKPTKNHKAKPISTQLYNYLAREIMPTVGVGLVGLMVTAGLASYFLFPFGAARRNYEVDRRDKEGSYYYADDYSGGMPEEEAIGKVIAGMPGNSLFENSYKAPTSRNAYFNSKYRLTDRKAQIQRNPYGNMVQGTVENVPITSMNQDQDRIYDKQSYQSSNYEPYFSDNKFVVGNVPKEAITEVTPAAVPEHGPRNLQTNYEGPIFMMGNQPLGFTRKVGIGSVPEENPRSMRIRRKRSDNPNEIDNEIVSSMERDEITTKSNPDESDNHESATTTTTASYDLPPSDTTGKPETSTSGSESTGGLPDKISSFIDLMKELIHYKAKLGLQMIQNATQSISKYITRVQARLDEHYRQNSKNNV